MTKPSLDEHGICVICHEALDDHLGLITGDPTCREGLENTSSETTPE